MSENSQSTQHVLLNSGDHLGPYRIEREIGSGGMADVFFAIHEGLQRPAAVKVLRASLASDEVHLQRFLQEARAAASLVHPNIVQVYDVGHHGQHRYIAQEFVSGVNLRQYLTKGKSAYNSQPSLANHDEVALDRQLPLGETLSILLQVLAALNKSANSGIVHRDIKPENIMLTEEGDVKVADFGLARLLLGDDPQLTRAGTTLGTPMYMSPEQIQDGQVDIRSDLYSLGVTLYHMLTGRPPFTGDTPLALAMKHVQATVPELAQFRAGLPDSIIQLISRLLSKSPNDRFANPSEVLQFLKQQKTGDLASVWPDQTVPLPGAAPRGSRSPSQSTLVFQSKLRTKRRNFRKSVLQWLVAAGLLLSSFVVGAVMAFTPPFQLFDETPADIFKDIPPQATAEAQYRTALLSNDAHRVHKWEAVEYYFPKDKDEWNRLYAGLASLQLARALRDQGDFDKALLELKKTISDTAMEGVVKAFAQLEVASVQVEIGNDSAVADAVEKAIAIVKKEDFPSRDRQHLDDVVRLMQTKIQKRWFGGLGE